MSRVPRAVSSASQFLGISNCLSNRPFRGHTLTLRRRCGRRAPSCVPADGTLDGFAPAWPLDNRRSAQTENEITLSKRKSIPEISIPTSVFNLRWKGDISAHITTTIAAGRYLAPWPETQRRRRYAISILLEAQMLILQSMLYRFREQQAAERGLIDTTSMRRPKNITQVDSIPVAEKWRGQVIRQISRAVTKIQDRIVPPLSRWTVGLIRW
jgi:Isy1-like splicing family